LGAFTVDLGADGSFSPVADEVRAEGDRDDDHRDSRPFGVEGKLGMECSGAGGAEGTIEVARAR